MSHRSKRMFILIKHCTVLVQKGGQVKIIKKRKHARVSYSYDKTLKNTEEQIMME